MSKPFKTLDEQISILKSRGLIVHDDESAKLSLLCNNYYNVINYYSKFFMIPVQIIIYMMYLLMKFYQFIILIKR